MRYVTCFHRLTTSWLHGIYLLPVVEFRVWEGYVSLDFMFLKWCWFNRIKYGKE
jgi:hypothetical protein